MAKTKIGLTSGKEFTVDGSIEAVLTKLDRANQRWTTFTEDKTRLEINPVTVAFLIELPPAKNTASPRAQMKRAVPEQL